MDHPGLKAGGEGSLLAVIGDEVRYHPCRSLAMLMLSHGLRSHTTFQNNQAAFRVAQRVYQGRVRPIRSVGVLVWQDGGMFLQQPRSW